MHAGRAVSLAIMLHRKLVLPTEACKALFIALSLGCYAVARIESLECIHRVCWIV